MYGAVLDMASWAETRGCIATVLSEHHAVDDGYLPSPVPLAAAIAARTSTMAISVAALLLALYEPVKLAEDLAVVDLLSRGRVSYVVGIGYRDEEFEMFGVDRRGRGRLVEARIELLRRLWSGEAVEFEGRRVRVTPLPYTPGGPMLAVRRREPKSRPGAPRVSACSSSPRTMTPTSRRHTSRRPNAPASPRSGCTFPTAGVPLTVFVADDPDRAWAEIGEYLLVDSASYAQWNAHRPDRVGVVRDHGRRAQVGTRRIPDHHSRRGRVIRRARHSPGAPTARRRDPTRHRVAVPGGSRRGFIDDVTLPATGRRS